MTLNIPIRRTESPTVYLPDPGPGFPSPADFGLPARYDHWRPRQWSAVSQIVNSPKRFFVLCAATGSGKSVTAMASALLHGGRVMALTSTKGLQDQYCLAPQTRVLTADLRWKPIGGIKVADCLLGFDESPAGKRRWWKRSVVEEVHNLKKPCWYLTFESGTEIIASEDHLWLVCGSKGGIQRRWIKTRDLRASNDGTLSSSVARISSVWEEDNTREAGYLAAAFDGEGHLSQHDYGDSESQSTNLRLAFCQSFNPMLDDVKSMLEEKGFQYTFHVTEAARKGLRDYAVLAISGGRKNIIRFLGQIRPSRLLPKLDIDKMGMIGPVVGDRLIHKEFIGLREVVGLKTSTRTFVAEGLASHNCSSFGDMIHDVRGMGNYRCPIAERLGMSRWTTVSDAACQMGYRCGHHDDDTCEYYARYRQAQRAKMLVTNYSCWMYDARKGAGGVHIPRWEYDANRKYGFDDTDRRTPIDMLICDEADLAGAWVSKYVGVDITRAECLALRLLWPDAGLVLNDWHGWAEEYVGGLAERIKAMEKIIRDCARTGRDDEAWSEEYRLLRGMHHKLERLAKMRAEDDWVLDEKLGEDVGAGRSLKAIRFDPLMPGRYAEQVLFRGVEKVVLMSATVRRKTANLLGVADDEMEFAEYPSTFDPKRRPVIYVPSIMMNYRNEQDDKLMMMHLARVDQIIKGRLDRKGVIHAVSYRRAEFLRDNSDYGQYMIIHNSHNRTEAVAKFKAAEAPCILVSPSVDTGYDFSDDLARYTIIAKIPFASVQNKIVKARQERDPEYGLFIAAQTMVQMSGRAVRCFDLETEILTTDGWKRYDEVRVGDTTYGIESLDKKRNIVKQRDVLNGAVMLTPNPIRAMKVNVVPEPLLHLYSPKGVDISVTPDHTMVAQVRRYSKNRVVSSDGLVRLPAKDLPARFKIMGAGKVSRKGPLIAKPSYKASVDWFRLMGIIISDGNVSKSKSEISIFQSKPSVKVWIDALLRRLKLSFRLYEENTEGTAMEVSGKAYTRNLDQTTWVIAGLDAARVRDIFDRGARRRYTSKFVYRKRRHQGSHDYDWVDGWKAVEKTIPRWVLCRASANQMKALLEGLMRGDGTTRRGGGTYFTADAGLADRIQELLVLSGYKSICKTRRGQYEISFCLKGSTDCVRSTTVRDGGVGPTWCVNTELGTVVARRNGKTFIAGNSESDWAETFIVDDNWRWFRHKVKAFVPGWWLEAVQEVGVVPPPLVIEGV